MPPGARRRRPWVPRAVLAIVAVIIIAAVAAWQLGYLRTNAAPKVSGVAVDEVSPNIGQQVTFTAQASDPQGGPLSYQWDFGDGHNATTTGAGTSHAYELAGNFIVLITVKNNAGLTSTNDNNLTFVNVQLPPPPAGAPSGKGPSPVALGAVDNNVPKPNPPVKFNANSSWQWVWNGKSWAVDTRAIKTYIWSFGDASPTVRGNITRAGVTNHTYRRDGNWFTTLTFQGDNGTGGYGITVRAATNVNVGIRNPGVFNTATFGEPQFLDPAVDYETSGGEILQNVYEGPLWFNGSSTTDLVPQLSTVVPSAQNGFISADGITYNWPIRANVKFHNNDPLTLDDVVYSWQRAFIIHDPSGPYWMMDLALFNGMIANFNGKPTTAYLSSLADAGFAAPKWLTDALAGHPTIDEDAVKSALNAAIFINTTATAPAGSVGVVTTRLVRPYPAHLKIAAFTVMSVVSRKVVEAHGGTVWA